MTISAAEIDAKVTKAATNMDRLDSIVNGGTTQTVAVDSGTVPTIPKFFFDNQAEFDAFMASVAAGVGGKMDKSANLSDVANVVTARTNLGLGNAFSIDPVVAYRGFSEINGTWTISSATASNVDGYMRITATGLDQIAILEGISLSGAANRYVAIRYRIMNGVRDGGVYWATTAHPVIDGAYRANLPADGGDGVWQTVVIDMWNPDLGGTGWKDGTVTALRFDFTSEIGAVADIAWIAICADTIPLGASEFGSMSEQDANNVAITGGYASFTGSSGIASPGNPRFEVDATDESTAYVRLRRGAAQGFYDIAYAADGNLVINHYDSAGNFTGQPLTVYPNNFVSFADGIHLHGDLRAHTQFFFGYGLATGGLSSLGMFVQADTDNVTIAGTNGAGGWGWSGALEWRSDIGTWNFNSRPTWNGVGLATVDEAASGGTGVAGVSSFNGRTGAVIGQAGDYTSLMISHGGTNVEALFTQLYNRTQFVSPEEYGLNGDGVTDNSAAWTAMMTALASSHPAGATIIWPAKNYYFASDITQSAPHNHIGVPNLVTNSGKGTRWSFGATASFVINKQNGGKYSGIAWLKAAQGTHLVRWKQATVEGESGSTYITFEDCYMSGECTVATLYMTNCLLILFDKCRFFNSYKGAACKVVWLDGSQFGVAGNVRSGDNVDNIEFKTCIATGYQMVSTSDYAVAIDGFVIDGKAHSTKFSQCKALYCYYGVALVNSGPTTDFPKFTRFAQGGMENCYKNGIKANKGDLTVFSDMYASLDSSVDSGTVYGNTDVVIVDTTYIGTMEFIGCQIRGGKRDAYRLEGGRTQITGGQCANSAIRTTGYSVDILSSVDGVIMQGVDCRTMVTGSTGQSYAIRNLATADIIVNGCNLKGYTAAFQSGGTGTGITGNLT